VAGARRRARHRGGRRREGGHLTLAAAERGLLERYLDELYEWNTRFNLTRVPPEEAWGRHVEEALALVAAVPPPLGARVVDVGSGAGIPGVPIAVVRPDVEVVLCDSDHKRAGFLAHVVEVLGLRRVEVAAVRAEELGRTPEAREAFDTAVSRATAPPPALCELCLPLLRVGGTMAALVSDARAAAAACAAAAEACGGGTPTAVTSGVLGVAKERRTPDRYPRRPGIPARRPIL
jgi:16S rRNA (guanine527-N7)-methyltransferase